MAKSKQHRVGIIMNGVTGRMGTNQHLLRSIAAIIKQGGVRLGEGETIMPDPILVGRNELKLKHLAAISGVEKCTTDLAAVLKDAAYPVYFDAQTTERRAADVRLALQAGKHVYCEKPVATTSAEALSLYRLAQKAKLKHGVVQDKLWLPGFLKLKRLLDQGFFGRVMSVRGEFGYWVFTGEDQPAQRPSWNYRQEDGGGIIMDMFAHWEYVLANLFGEVRAVSCLAATHIPERRDEAGKTYKCTADDAAYATFEQIGRASCRERVS
jgi:predicted dehydrogenase